MATVFGGRTVTGEQDGSNIGGHSCVVECPVEFVDGSGAKCVTNLGAVKSDTYGAEVTGPVTVVVAFYMPVVGDVLEIEALDFSPDVWVKNIGNFFWNRVVTHMV